jgi:drug/metabolite transporter (DMT)-like permease
MSMAQALQNPSLRRQGWMCALAGAVAFSGKAIVAKLLYKLGADAYSVVGMRMALAFPMFLAMAWWAGRPAIGFAEGEARQGGAGPSRGRAWQIVGLGFCGYYLASTLDFLGLQYISASLERAILYLNPSMVLLLSVFWLRQTVRWPQVLAMAVSYTGVVIVWLHDWDAAALVASTSHGMDALAAITLGSVFVFFSALSYAIYLIGSGRLVHELGTMRLVGQASCVACLMVWVQWLLVYVGSGGAVGGVAHLPWQAWALSLLNATACTVLPVWLVMRGVQILGSAVASQVGMVGPLSTIWMAAVVLDEPVTARLLLGTAAVLAGMLILARMSQAKPAVGAR